MNYTMLRDVYTCDFSRCDSHPGVCNKLMTVYVERHPLMISSSLSSTLASIKHILQDVNRKAQNRTCKQPFKRVATEKQADSQNSYLSHLPIYSPLTHERDTKYSHLKIYLIEIVFRLVHTKRLRVPFASWPVSCFGTNSFYNFVMS